MYARGITEVFMLEADDLKVLREYHHRLPIEFINTIDILKTFPANKLFKDHNNSINYKYFG